MPGSESKDVRRQSAIEGVAPIRRPSSSVHYHVDWYERIEKAKRALEQGRKARKGKPATFSARQGL